MNMEKNTLQQFGLHLRKLRINRKLTQSQLAELGDFDRNYIGMLERGERNPSLLNLVKLSNALGLPLSEFLNFMEYNK